MGQKKKKDFIDVIMKKNDSFEILHFNFLPHKKIRWQNNSYCTFLVNMGHQIDPHNGLIGSAGPTMGNNH